MAKGDLVLLGQAVSGANAIVALTVDLSTVEGPVYILGWGGAGGLPNSLLFNATDDKGQAIIPATGPLSSNTPQLVVLIGENSGIFAATFGANGFNLGTQIRNGSPNPKSVTVTVPAMGAGAVVTLRAYGYLKG